MTAGEGRAAIEAITPTIAVDLLRRNGLAPRKADGQNFITDANTVRRILDAARLEPDDHVLEVGPGLGSMTLLLPERVRRVTAVEIDSGLAALLERMVGDRVEVVHADVLSLDLVATFGDDPVRLLSNLPYNVATPILVTVLDSGIATDAYVMSQREVGERWTARAGDDAYGAVSVKLALLGDASIDMQVPRAVFHPVPNVDSVMVRVAPHAEPLSTDRRRQVGNVVEAAFTQRRKTLRNNLRRTLGDDAAEVAAATGLDLGRRAETLDVDEFVALTEALVAGGIPVSVAPW